MMDEQRMQMSASMISGEWVECGKLLPPDGKTVMTKIDDPQGCRNVQELKRQGRLWFLSDGSMYVYYTPTHWVNHKEKPR